MYRMAFGGADYRTCGRFTDDFTAWPVIGLVRAETEWATMVPGDKVSRDRGRTVVIVNIKFKQVT